MSTGSSVKTAVVRPLVIDLTSDDELDKPPEKEVASVSSSPQTPKLSRLVAKTVEHPLIYKSREVDVQNRENIKISELFFLCERLGSGILRKWTIDEITKKGLAEWKVVLTDKKVDTKSLPSHSTGSSNTRNDLQIVVIDDDPEESVETPQDDFFRAFKMIRTDNAQKHVRRRPGPTALEVFRMHKRSVYTRYVKNSCIPIQYAQRAFAYMIRRNRIKNPRWLYFSSNNDFPLDDKRNKISKKGFMTRRIQLRKKGTNKSNMMSIPEQIMSTNSASRQKCLGKPKSVLASEVRKSDAEVVESIRRSLKPHVNDVWSSYSDTHHKARLRSPVLILRRFDEPIVSSRVGSYVTEQNCVFCSFSALNVTSLRRHLGELHSERFIISRK